MYLLLVDRDILRAQRLLFALKRLIPPSFQYWRPTTLEMMMIYVNILTTKGKRSFWSALDGAAIEVPDHEQLLVRIKNVDIQSKRR